MKIELEKFTTCDDWFYLIIDDECIRTIRIDEIIDAAKDNLIEGVVA